MRWDELCHLWSVVALASKVDGSYTIQMSVSCFIISSGTLCSGSITIEATFTVTDDCGCSTRSKYFLVPGGSCTCTAKLAVDVASGCSIGPSFTRPTVVTSSATRALDGETVLVAVMSLPKSPRRPPGTGHRQLLVGACVWSTSEGGIDDDDAEVFRTA